MLKLVAIVVLYQPFYDGNHRIALEMMKQILRQSGYDFCYSLRMGEILETNSFIPIVYNEDFDVCYEQIEKASKYITKIDVESKSKIRSKKMISFVE